MKLSLSSLLLFFTLNGCPHPLPPPAPPAACALAENIHDDLSDRLMADLQDDSWDLLVQQRVAEAGKDAVRCVLQEIAADTKGAPIAIGKAAAWLQANP